LSVSEEAVSPLSEAPDARAARADPRVTEMLYRTALSGDRVAAIITVLVSLVLASLVHERSNSRIAWGWCALCVFLAGLRFVVNRPRRFVSATATPLARRPWLLLLFAASAMWGAGAPLLLVGNPAADALLTGIFLAAAGLSAPLVSAWRPAVYLSVLPALVPLLVTLALQALFATQTVPGNSLLLAAIAAGFLLVLERLTMAQNDSLALLMAARFSNEDLVGQLRSQVDVAALANQEKTRFVASAAHDLRQPLHALGMFCATLEQRLNNTRKSRWSAT